MAKDFNVYQWRREHLNENQESFSDAFNKDNKVNNFTKPEKVDYTERYFGSMISQNENQGGLKVSTLKLEDTKGMKLPFNITAGAYISELNSVTFEEWKESFIDKYGDADLTIEGNKFIPSNKEIDILDKNAAAAIRGAVGTVD